jgi:molybdopterin synthase catalytic subunit
LKLLSGRWPLALNAGCYNPESIYCTRGFMDILKMFDTVKSHPDYDKAGMILCHNGVVRSTSRDGRRVSGLRVSVDHKTLDQIISEQKQKPGIIDVQVEIAEDEDLHVGDDVMLLVVAGDIRENVIAVLTETLNKVKSTVTDKTEFYL